VHDLVVEGRRVRYADYGEGAPVVLVHGLGGSWQSWLENIPSLGRANRVVALDLPGFGASGVLAPGAAFERYVEVLDATLERLGLEQVVLVGHSMGGLLAGRYAAAHPRRLRGLVLVGAGGIALSPRRLRAIVRAFLAFNAVFARPAVTRAFTRRPRLRRALLAGMLHDRASLSGELAAEVLPLMAAPGFAGAVVAAAAAAADPGFEQIATPTLLIWGRQDRILPVGEAARLAQRMADARLEVLEDTGHAPMIERPHEFNALVAGFDAELRPRGSRRRAPRARRTS